MGLERIAAVLQGKHDNYDIDLLRALIEASADATGDRPRRRRPSRTGSLPTICAQRRFLIADGVLPSNEGRGYVLRRIMRRGHAPCPSARCSRPADAPAGADADPRDGRAFPELVRAEALITETLKLEETRFRRRWTAAWTSGRPPTAASHRRRTLAGETAFKLYDTFGFPLDLTQDALRAPGRYRRHGRLHPRRWSGRRPKPARPGPDRASGEAASGLRARRCRRHRIPGLRNREGRGAW
jgi:alanyl-tRNA synthetase